MEPGVWAPSPVLFLRPRLSRGRAVRVPHHKTGSGNRLHDARTVWGSASRCTLSERGAFTPLGSAPAFSSALLSEPVVATPSQVPSDAQKGRRRCGRTGARRAGGGLSCCGREEASLGALTLEAPKPCVPSPGPSSCLNFLRPQCRATSSEKPSWIFHIQTEGLPLHTVLGPLRQLLCTCLIHPLV